jgi:hypothetical protein
VSLFVNSWYNVEDYHISEESKNTFDYHKKTADFLIAYLVREKTHIATARNLYDGIRNNEEFKYLETTFGIETPFSVRMTPLIKTKIDTLLGLLLDQVLTYTVSVSDEESILKVEEAKEKQKLGAVFAEAEKFLKTLATDPEADPLEKDYLKKLADKIDANFISNFEIAVQHLIKFFENDKTIKLKQVLKLILLDLVVSGEAYYRVYTDRVGEDPKIEICKPENVFYSKRTDHQFLKNGHEPNIEAVIHRTYMTRRQILTKYGHVMNEKALANLFGSHTYAGGRNIVDARQLDYMHRYENYYDSGTQVHNQHTNSNLDTLPVYHVEWLANNPVEIEDEAFLEDFQNVEDLEAGENAEFVEGFYGENPGSGKPKKTVYRLDRYEAVRIGWDIYLNCGKSKHIVRSAGQPWKTTLSYNGLCYNDRNGRPYSIVLSLKDIQDSYDIIKFFRDNLIANSGVNGSRVNLAAIPKVLGANYMERLLKFIAFRKQGLEVYDPTEDGANLFSAYGDFNASLDPNLIQTLALVLEGLEAEADTVTGINRFMYQAAEQRDAVANVRIGQQTTSLLTKDIFELVQELSAEMLTDLVNQARIAYKHGKRGAYILGDKQITFNIAPENFCFTDYNIQIVNSDKEKAKIQKLHMYVPELIKAGALDTDIIVDLVMNDSTTKIVNMVRKRVAEKKEENNQLAQMQQQLEETSKQLEGLTQENEKLKSLQLQLKEKEVQIKQLDAAERNKNESRRLDIEERRVEGKEKEVEHEAYVDKQIINLEREEIYASEARGNSREVKNDLR